MEVRELTMARKIILSFVIVERTLNPKPSKVFKSVTQLLSDGSLKC
jgi:hypothetical protein